MPARAAATYGLVRAGTRARGGWFILVRAECGPASISVPVSRTHRRRLVGWSGRQAPHGPWRGGRYRASICRAARHAWTRLELDGSLDAAAAGPGVICTIAYYSV